MRETILLTTKAKFLNTLVGRMAEFGITRLADVTNLDRIGIPVALAIRPAARSVSVSQGKGVDLTSAKISALMEAVEVWHAENIALPLTLDSIANVTASGHAVDVSRLPQVAGQARSPQARLLWVEGVELGSGRKLLLPFEMVHADYAEPVKPGYGLFPASTNGLASGATHATALRSALCEVIERDAVAVWSTQSAEARAKTRIDLASIDHPIAAATCGKIRDAGLEAAVWDVATDVAVASFLCLIWEGVAGLGHIGLGSGTHPRRHIALVRALTEAAQTRLTYVTGSRDDLTPAEFTPRGLMGKSMSVKRLLADSLPTRHYNIAPSFENAGPEDEVSYLLDCLAACGMKGAVAVHLDKPGVGIPVVRVIVPGLEAPHDDPGYVPGPRARAAAERQ
ncbi:YcaO-like family protein [Aurantimonas sp. A2-1-M11]|uniref:YcaO-like family protein n=1 Tax=Aurantimonas sp. A2-1-M11 TaxID=3113712 RepID=UPI002F926C22